VICSRSATATRSALAGSAKNPDNGTCQSSLAYRIERGEIDGVDERQSPSCSIESIGETVGRDG
jgi:hypothetical protein